MINLKNIRFLMAMLLSLPCFGMLMATSAVPTPTPTPIPAAASYGCFKLPYRTGVIQLDENNFLEFVCSTGKLDTELTLHGDSYLYKKIIINAGVELKYLLTQPHFAKFKAILDAKDKLKAHIDQAIKSIEKYDEARKLQADSSIERSNIGTATASLALFEIGQLSNSRFAKIVAEILCSVDECISVKNEQIDHNAYLDFVGIGVSVVAHFAAIRNLLKKTDKVGQAVEGETASKDEFNERIETTTERLGKYAQHLSRALAVVRSCTKTDKIYESGKIAETCTAIITLCNIAILAAQTADSKSKIVKALPLVLGIIAAVTTTYDQTTDQAIWKK